VPITIHPNPGQILFCDFSQGFKAPEMVKNKRPVVILTGVIRGRSKLVTVVPLSTVAPELPQPYHYMIPKQSMPMVGKLQDNDSWLKGDMIYTVGFHRLDLIQLGKRGENGKRQYYKDRLGRDQMRQIYQCVLHGLNLSKLVPHV
jgi:mRNA interferase MazF